MYTEYSGGSMNKKEEFKISVIILLIGLLLLTGCMNSKKTVIFKTNGGTEIKNISVKSGNKIDKPQEPVKEGYTFVGWYKDGEEYDFTSKINDNIVLVAKWEKNEVNTLEDEDITSKTTTTKKTTSKTTIKTSTKLVNKNSTKISTTKKSKKTTTKKTTTTTTNTIKEVTTTFCVYPTTKEITTTKLVRKLSVNTIDKQIVIKEDIESTLISKISEEDILYILDSKKSDWQIYINDVLESNVIYNELTKEININTINNENVIKLTLIIDDKVFIIEKENTTFTIYYPTIISNNKYYINLELSLQENEEVTLLKDYIVDNTITLDKSISINGNNHKLTSLDKSLFKINDLNTTINIVNTQIEYKELLCIKDDLECIDNVLLDLYSKDYLSKID